MPAIADLELSLALRGTDQYGLDLRYTQPDGNADIRVSSMVPLTFDLDALRAAQLNPAEYGPLLTAQLFADTAVHTAFVQARSATAAADAQLRLRLFLAPNASALHALRWELLVDPADKTPLATSERVLFSRYLSASDWRPVRLRPKGDLRALVAIANPNNLAAYTNAGQPLAPIDVVGELGRAQTGLADIATTALHGGGAVSLNRLVDALRDGPDILYLVAHGALARTGPQLWLETDDGATALVPGAELVARLRDLDVRPRLVVLASCQSAGTGDDATAGDGALAALGPQLAEIGIPAVIAMQGNVTMKSVATFTPTFFRELTRTGVLDQALAAARGAIRARPDSWMPVLFSRLRNGRIWYVPGAGDDGAVFEKWPALLSYVNSDDPATRYCTPIIGPGIDESLLGTTRTIAQTWAKTYNFPMASHASDDLPQVAQYLSINQTEDFPKIELARHLKQQLRARFGEAIGDLAPNAPLMEHIARVGAARRTTSALEPNTVLAARPFKIFLTTTTHTLLADALTAAGKQPVVEICKWHDDLVDLPSIYDKEPDYRASPERPLVYHLFGHLRAPESVVLTEDDYFNYLIGFARNKDLVPAEVRRAMADSALLFVGFELDSWDFRVLFRSVMSQEGGVRRKRFPHVGVQVNLEEGRIAEPDHARRYLTSYFKTSEVSLYWGSSDDFIRDFAAEAAKSQAL